MNKSLLLCLCALLCFAPLSTALAADSAAVLGILEIRGLDTLAASAFELSKAGGQPVPKEMASMVLYGALGSMPGMGIQPQGTVRALWLDNGTEKGAVALLLPVENEGADYLAGLGQAGWKNDTETAEGIEHFTAPDTGSGTLWREIYFLKRGATLVAAQTADDVRKADEAMPALPPILPAEGDVVLQIRPAALMDVFEPQIQEQMDQAFQADANTPPEAQAMGKLYIKGYMALARQLADFSLGLGVADGNLNIHTRLAPVANSTLATWLASVKSPSAAASVVNLPGALYAQTAHLGDLNLIAPAYFRYVEELLALLPEEFDAAAIQTYLANEKIYLAQMGGDFGIALLTPTKEQPLRLVEYISLKDATGLRDLTRQMLQSTSAMMAAMASSNSAAMPFALSLTPGEPRTYRDIAVDTVAYRLAPNAQIAAMWPEGFPTQFDIELAWVPGGLLASVGDPALTEAMIDRALDGTAAPLAALPAWKAAYPMAEKDLVDVTHFALFDTLRSYLGVADSITGGALAANIPAGPGNLESASYLAMGGLMSRVRFSLADIGAIGQKAKEAQEKAMAAQMEMMQQMQGMDMDGAGDPAFMMEDSESGSWSPDADAEESLIETDGEMEEAPAEEAPAPAAAE